MNGICQFSLKFTCSHSECKWYKLIMNEFVNGTSPMWMQAQFEWLQTN